MGLPAKHASTLGESPPILVPLPAAKIIKSIFIGTMAHSPQVVFLFNYFLRSFCKAFNLAAASASCADAME